MENRTTAKDFFLHLGAVVSLYASAIAFLNLLFSVIDKLYPEISAYSYYTYSNISFPVATLIVVFPLFIILSRFIYASYLVDQSKKELGVRKWLTYITLFVAGIILAGDLVYILYKFLDGQNITAAFGLKALAILVVSGAVFGFYLQDIREKTINRKMWAVISLVLVVVSVVFGFSVIGSPRTQRLIRYDDQKTQDLQNIQWQVISYWQKKGSLPVALAEVNDPISGYVLPVDPQSNLVYEYKKTGNITFQLCANFNLASQDGNVTYPKTQDNWQHAAGSKCFDRIIDPELYPVIKK